MKQDTASLRPARRPANWSLVLALAAAMSALAYYLWLERVEAQLPDGIVVSDGILNATEVPVATSAAGEIAALSVEPGTTVTAGTALLRLRTAAGDTIAVAAPRGGRVERLQVRAGDRVEAGQVVAVVTDLADLTMVAPFPATLGIPVGAEARLNFREFRETPIPARVTTVAQPDGGTDPAAQGRTATVTVEVTDTRSAPLKAGLRGRVYLRLREGAPWPPRIR
ncbi:HlyD family efflux transporter periplasmic adaptor subunit [Prosthecomicrobium sp. N25]|uniref:HlyD family efflux transporter periplasmic adaptor subunit n=1 Tax=Prosthecomicrobium sp. N25 TaxID=3129254 RepID=UPI003077E2AF